MSHPHQRGVWGHDAAKTLVRTPSKWNQGTNVESGLKALACATRRRIRPCIMSSIILYLWQCFDLLLVTAGELWENCGQTDSGPTTEILYYLRQRLKTIQKDRTADFTIKSRPCASLRCQSRRAGSEPGGPVACGIGLMWDESKKGLFLAKINIEDVAYRQSVLMNVENILQ